MTQKEKEIATAIAELANECREFFEKISQTELQDSALLDEALGKLKLMHEMGIVMRYLHVNLDEIKKDIPKVVAAETVIRAKKSETETTSGQAPAAVVVEKIFEVPDDEPILTGGGQAIEEEPIVPELPYATEEEIVEDLIAESAVNELSSVVEQELEVAESEMKLEAIEEPEAVVEVPAVPMQEREPIAFASIQNPAHKEEETKPEPDIEPIVAPEEQAEFQVESIENTIVDEVVPAELADVHPVEAIDEVISKVEEVAPAAAEPADVITQSERKHILDALSKEFQSSSELSVHEKIGVKKSSGSLLEKLKMQPIANLKSAIAINQRFLFSNELFKGNMEAFNQAINELNHLESLDEALRFINLQLAEKYLWDYENPTVVQFVELVERRYL